MHICMITYHIYSQSNSISVSFIKVDKTMSIKVTDEVKLHFQNKFQETDNTFFPRWPQLYTKFILDRDQIHKCIPEF